MKRKHSDWSEPPGTGNWLLIDALSRVAWGMVESDSADLAIVGAPSEVELPPRLSVVPFAGHPFEVIFPVGHPLGKVRKMGLCDILRYPPILAAEDSSARLQFDHVVGEAGLPSQVNVVMTAGNVPSILNYVGLGMGVAILTRSAIEAIPFPAVKKERAKVSVPRRCSPRRCTNSPE